MPNADIAGNGAVWVGLEPTYGTPVDPTDSGVGVWVPIISESLAYTEDKYYTPQIRNSAISSDVEQAPYHVAGDIVMEVDANYLPYFLYASRHTVVKTGTGPFVYTATPTNIGATYPGGAARGLSIVAVRNHIGFLYSGCVVGQWAYTIENGVLRVTMSMMGLAEADTSTADPTSTESWIDASLFGAASHSIYVDDAGTSPTFASPDLTFNGYTFTANYNCTPQNRLTSSRSATYVAYGETEATYDTELDFTSKAEYNNMKDNTLRAIKMESLKGDTTFATADEANQIIAYKTSYSTYEVGLSGIGDLLMARVNGRSLGLAGGVPFQLVSKSAADIT
jgi:hypothetical protein